MPSNGPRFSGPFVSMLVESLTGLAHWSQNLALGRFSVLQLGQFMDKITSEI